MFWNLRRPKNRQAKKKSIFMRTIRIYSFFFDDFVPSKNSKNITDIENRYKKNPQNAFQAGDAPSHFFVFCLFACSHIDINVLLHTLLLLSYIPFVANYRHCYAYSYHWTRHRTRWNHHNHIYKFRVSLNYFGYLYSAECRSVAFLRIAYPFQRNVPIVFRLTEPFQILFLCLDNNGTVLLWCGNDIRYEEPLTPS